MSQEDLAEVLNVTRQTISNWENRKNYPDIETLIRISDEFNVSLDILLKEDMIMVKEIDENVKNAKKYKKIVIAFISVLAIIMMVFGIYGITYLNTKDKLENKFQETLEEYEFDKNSGRYYSMNYDENTTFIVPNLEMPKLLDFSLHLYNANLICNIDHKNSYTRIVWSDSNEYTATTYSKSNNETLGSTSGFKRDDFNNMKKLSKELQIEELEIKDIIAKGNDLYKEFYK